MKLFFIPGMKLLLHIVAIICALAGVTIAGLLVGRSFAEHYVQEKALAKEKMVEQDIISQLSLRAQPGFVFPDIQLSSVQGETRHLHSVIDDRALVSVMAPDCGYCERQLKAAMLLLAKARLPYQLIMISEGNWGTFEAAADDSLLGQALYFDETGAISDSMGISSYPISFVVNKSCVIERIVPRSLSAEEIHTLLISQD